MSLKHYLLPLLLVMTLVFYTPIQALHAGLEAGITDYSSVLRLSNIRYYGLNLHIPTTFKTDLMVTLEHSFGSTQTDDSRFISIANNQPLASDSQFSYTSLGFGGHYFLNQNAKGAFIHFVPKLVYFSSDSFDVIGVSLETGVGYVHRLASVLVRPYLGVHWHTLIGQWKNGSYYDFDSQNSSAGFKFGIQFSYSPYRKPSPK